jgi:hypothetical protein
MQKKVVDMNGSTDILILQFSRIDFKSKLIWHDKNEFEFNGKMYDVIRIEEGENGIIIYCLNDEKEEILISNFKKLNDVKGEQKNCITVRHNNFVMYAVKNDNQFINRYYNTYPQTQTVTINYNSVSIDIITPPPRNPA